VLFFELRSLADIVLIGAGTVRAERYGPVRLDETRRARRRDAGLPPVPPIAVVTGSAQLDWRSAFFTEAEQRPVVITVSSADQDALSRAAEVADVIIAGATAVDMTLALTALGQRGYRNVLTEGGPILIAQLIAGGLLDELCLTVAPKLMCGDAIRITNGPALSAPVDLDLVHVLEAENYLFLRYTTAAAAHLDTR
jgi:riboflavin biosynthesis pyrimidine reductase